MRKQSTTKVIHKSSPIIVGKNGTKGSSVINYTDLYNKLTVEKVRSKLRIEIFIKNLAAILNAYEKLFINTYPDPADVESAPDGYYGIGIPEKESDKQCKLATYLRDRYINQLMITECASKADVTLHSWRYHHNKYIRELKDWLINRVYDNQLALALLDNGHLSSDKKLFHVFLLTVIGYINTYKFMSSRYDHGNFGAIYNCCKGVDLRGYRIHPHSAVNTSLNAIYERFLTEIRKGVDSNGEPSTNVIADIYKTAPNNNLADVIIAEIYR